MFHQSHRSHSARRSERAQSHVVGVALMLGLAVIALGVLTVGVASLVDSQASMADAERVADGFDQAIQGSERTGYHSHRIHFADGRLQTEERTLRVLQNGTVIESRDIDALVFENDEYRVTATAGAVFRDSGHSSSLVTEPSITSSRESQVLVVSAPVLNASHVSTGGQGPVSKTLETNVSHNRETLGTGEFQVAIETDRTGPFERYFEETTGSVDVKRFPGDGHDSVVATFPGQRQGYLVTHSLDLEVT